MLSRMSGHTEKLAFQCLASLLWIIKDNFAWRCRRLSFHRTYVCDTEVWPVLLLAFYHGDANFTILLQTSLAWFTTVPSQYLSLLTLPVVWCHYWCTVWHLNTYVPLHGNYTVSGKKRGHVIFNYNSRILWSIFVIFVPLETGINVPQSHVIYLLKIFMTS